MSQPRNLRRSFAALLSGFAAVVILSIAMDALMHGTGIFPPLGQPMPDLLFFVALTYRTLIGILGGYLVARLAPDRPMRHALLSGGIGLVISAVGVVLTWNAGPEFGPHWYPIALSATALPTSWAGAYIQTYIAYATVANSNHEGHQHRVSEASVSNRRTGATG